MKVAIENYRGWEISFDTDKETFYCVSDGFDRQEEKKSFAAIKKFIDDFIKENQEFKPFLAQKLYYGSFEKAVKIIGIRKDGRFFYEKDNGDKGQISEHEEKTFILVNEINKPIEEKILRLKKERDSIGNEISELEKEIIKVTLKDVKKNLQVI